MRRTFCMASRRRTWQRFSRLLVVVWSISLMKLAKLFGLVGGHPWLKYWASYHPKTTFHCWWQKPTVKLAEPLVDCCFETRTYPFSISQVTKSRRTRYLALSNETRVAMSKRKQSLHTKHCGNTKETIFNLRVRQSYAKWSGRQHWHISVRIAVVRGGLSISSEHLKCCSV